MAEDVRGLIARIQEEGIQAAEEKARLIEASARRQADDILARARREAEEMVTAAAERARREDEKGRTLLAQAGRDFLLSLRNEIQAMLGRVLAADVGDALTPGTLETILPDIVRHMGEGEDGDVTIALRPQDLEVLERHFLHRLAEETRHSIRLSPSDEIGGGFTISFDRGKSCYEFTDQALADYLGTYLKPRLSGILQGAVKE